MSPLPSAPHLFQGPKEATVHLLYLRLTKCHKPEHSTGGHTSNMKLRAGRVSCAALVLLSLIAVSSGARLIVVQEQVGFVCAP